LSVTFRETGEKKDPLFNYLRDQLKLLYNITVVKVVAEKDADLVFLTEKISSAGKPAYKLEVSSKGISIISNTEEGAFYALQTLLQLFPTDQRSSRIIPYVEIFDYARFDYRGMHLDVARHFSPVSFVKRYIDYLAYHKFNYFHWHLTEDQGWRIEIKKYPKLTETGAWRNGTITGRYPGLGNDNIKHGGFYTQEEVKEIVKYAADRYITVIPEIEMPGHSSAAIAAYPFLSCFPEEPTKIPATMISNNSSLQQAGGQKKLVQETWGIFEDVFCAGKEETFSFLQDVMDEVLTLFPSKYIHVGGDECPKENWKRCPNCQARMKKIKLKDEHELQSYFIQRMEKYLNKKGRTLIGWDEILEGGLAPNAIVMSWRGEEGGIAAAKDNHQVIMTPGSHVYLDHAQSENEDSVTIGGYTSVEKIYGYEPIPAVLNDQQAKLVLGAQGNVWTEYMKTHRKVEYMIFPRMSALSEVLWSPKEKRDWPGFEKRLVPHFKRYDLWKANYSKAYFDLKATVLPTENFDGVLWKLETKLPQAEIKYITHAAGRPYELRFTEGTTYTTPIEVKSSQIVAAISMVNGKPVSNPVHHTILYNKATGKKITLLKEPAKNYPGDGAFTLVNGIQNTMGRVRSKEFLGFSGTDCEALIDLGSDQLFSSVTVHSFRQAAAWIFPPQSMEVFVSANGAEFISMGLTNEFTESKNLTGKGSMTVSFKTVPVRYVKVVIKNRGVIPPGNPGEGNKTWLFVDEIEVN
ncbi:MAG TPA: beta-N-acetylhexosaminidase, partial [Chitinophagaceae bacterium]|nr:beta-N-acetylhexosaminidase [Chitinophagaceae bacterium]